MKTDSSLIGRRVVVLKDVYNSQSILENCEMLAAKGEVRIVKLIGYKFKDVLIEGDDFVKPFYPDELELVDE